MGQAPVVSGPDGKLDASTEDVRHSLVSIVVKTTLVVAEGVVDMFFLSSKRICLWSLSSAILLVLVFFKLLLRTAICGFVINVKRDFLLGCWFFPMSAVFFPISSSKGVFSNVRSVFSNFVKFIFCVQ